MLERKILLMIVFGMFVFNQVNAQKIQLPKLAKELRSMRNTDQKLRIKWAKLAKSGKTKTKKFAKISEKLLAIDLANTKRMKEIIDEYGWPTYDLVGKKSSVSAWLLVQHADRDPFFQIKCLPLLKAAADNGQADLVNYAFLYDRVQVAKGEKQLYATQSTTNNGIKKGHFQPIEDEANIQNRRAEFGFDLHIETYAKKIGIDYKIPNKKEAENRATAYVESYNNHISKAKKALKNKDYKLAVINFEEALKSNGSTKTEDYIAAARAISLSKHESSKWAAFYLIRATIRGYENCRSFLEDKDFEYLKEASPKNWDNLIRIVNEVKINKK